MTRSTTPDLPTTIETEEQLDEVMTRPSPALAEFVGTLTSPLLVIGGSGKMGPTLAVLARRAAEVARHDLEIVAASRFTDPEARRWLEDRGVQTLRCDLLERDQVAELPDAKEIVYMAGRKFGTSGAPALTWAMNTMAPANVAERFPNARIAAMSTGCVYPLVPAESAGSIESDDLTPPGEYANACVARERVFDYWSAKNGTRICHVRLNYALDLRYGVLVDIAARVFAGRPVDLEVGWLNCIWQGDANEAVIRSLGLAESPPRALNVTGPERLSVRALAIRFGEMFGREPIFTGEEGSTALLSDASQAISHFGPPNVPVETVIGWIASWIAASGRTLGKPTHFEVSDGRY